jgi:serine phosphatase RsbU (regulator of sigma subunit)
MTVSTLGLRGKSLIALLLASLLALLPVAFLGWHILADVREHAAQTFARDYTRLNRERILAPVSRELALSQRLADSEVTRQWMLAEADPAKRALFFREMAGYQHDFREHSWFAIVGGSRHYYFNDPAHGQSTEPRYTLNPAKKADGWYFATVASPQDFNLNVDYDVPLNATKVWINVLVKANGKVVGLAGTGLELTRFLQDFVVSDEPGVTPMVLDAAGAIQAHPDHRRIAFNSAVGLSADKAGIYGLLDDDASRQSLRQALARLPASKDGLATVWVQMQGHPQLLAATWIPELKWFVVTLVDPHAAHVVEARWLTPVVLVLVVLLLILLLVYGYMVDRLVLRPLRHLQQSAQAIAAGHYHVSLPADREDELGELSRAFSAMAGKVRANTEELEQRVRERTEALEQANRDMVAAHRKIDDSIDYASLIQHAILPSRQLGNTLPGRHTLLWRPRDVVGGDFYVYRSSPEGYLFGVVDCAGHGVPGALMTMLAHAAIDQAIAAVGMNDPAGIITRLDQIIRLMLSEEFSDRLASNMDVGLAWVSLERRTVTFSGARIALYYSDGDTVGELPGARRAVGDRRPGQFSNAEAALLPGRSFYLTTDGFLDQAGGDMGYSFGNSRFASMILSHAGLPLAEQAEVFNATLAAYQGEHAQRDDITLLCFRFD